MQLQTGYERREDPSGHEAVIKASLRPTVEITTATARRVTGWGWRCSCGDDAPPMVRSKSSVLEEARTHFDTKHGGDHGRLR